MKHLLATCAVAMTLSSVAHAQTTATGQASANVGVTAQSQSSAQGGSVNFPSTPSRTRANNTVTYDGDYTIRNVPQVTAPSMGSGHPCGLGNSLGISIVGGGATGGSTRSDDACLLAQMGHTQAATIMIAGRNKAACRALVAAGRISPNSYCGSGNRSATASTNATRAVAPAQPSNSATQRLAPASSVRPSSQPVVSSKAATTIPRGSVTCGSPISVKSWARDEVSNATAIAFCAQR